jgi:exodeoxyribonuclease V gamma subunit
VLLRQVQGSVDDGGIEPALAEDWLERSRGQGLLPPRAAGQLEALALQRRWSSLRTCLDQLGPSRQEPLAWGPWQAAPHWRGEAVVLIHTARERVPQRMDLWLQLLLAAAAGLEGGPVPRQGLLIAREKDSFKAVLRLAAPSGGEARTELERLATLRQDWRLPCWPVPPRTGMAYLAAERKAAGAGAAKAAEAWEGGFSMPGERLQEEMVICFGADLSAASLVEGQFAARATSLYGPLLEAQLEP